MERFVENPDFLQELFLEEAWKNVDKIDGFIESKANAEEFEVTAEEVNSLYRTMHSIKGSAAMMGYPAISETAHAAEDLFSYLREESAPAQKDLQSILQLLRMVSGFLKRELRRLETDDEVTDFGWAVVRRIKKHVASTSRLGVMGNIGAFGGMFDLSALNVKEPVLVSGTDGVGTKLKLAFEMDKHDTIGIDAVAMCVNDVLAQGAEPLFFLDYVAVGHNEPAKIEAIVAGVAEGCRQAGCALIGGETAEMPGMYAGGEYDIAGFTCGVVEKSRLIDGTKVRVGDVLVGIASSGVHSNGFSLVRKVVADAGLDLRKAYPELDGRVLGEVLLTPTKIYVKQVLEVIRACNVHGISHITGGGFDENIPRILSEGQGIEIHEGTWEILPVFRLLEKYGKIAHREMFNIFNMGIGMVIAVSQDEASEVIAILEKQGEKASVIGRATDRPGVEIR